jgi:hypothetical protein
MTTDAPAGTAITPSLRQLHLLAAERLHHHEPEPASAITTMNRIATDATIAAGSPSSCRAISAIDFAVAADARGHHQHVLNGAREAHADDQPHQSRGEPVLNREHGPIERPGAAIAAKWCPNSTQRLVGW